jgi:RNA polymerase II subunit A-like phosphatase
MIHETSQIMVTLEEAQRLEKDTAKRLLSSKKLSLILDLDQTVIHASMDHRIEKFYSNYPDIHRFSLLDHAGFYYVKIRPGLTQFLKTCTHLFELHIYTMGTRNYACEISKIIDPNREIFKERILSRTESGSAFEKNIQRLFPCDDSMVVIVDDRADVWKFSENLIKVRPYHFFVGVDDVNDVRKNVPFPPPPHEEYTPELEEKTALFFEDNDEELFHMKDILIRLHSLFYSSMEETGYANIKVCLSNMKSEVFGGINLAFSGIIPVHVEGNEFTLIYISREIGNLEIGICIRG